MSLTAIGIVSEKPEKTIEFYGLLGLELKRFGDSDHWEAATDGGLKAPWDAFWGQRYACVADPDGNQIDLFATL